MYLRKKSLVVFSFFIFMIASFVIAENGQDVSKLLDGHNVTVQGGMEGNSLNFISIGLDSDADGLGDIVMVFFDKNYQILNYYKGQRTSSVALIDYNDKFVVFRINTGKGDRGIVAYNIKKNKFDEYQIPYAWMYNLFIKDSLAFFSSEMGHPHLNYIDLKKKKMFSFEDIDCECAEFGVYKNKVYACSPTKDLVYRFTGKGFVKEEKIDKTKIQISNHVIDDFKIDEGILDRLGIR